METKKRKHPPPIERKKRKTHPDATPTMAFTTTSATISYKRKRGEKRKGRIKGGGEKRKKTADDSVTRPGTRKGEKKGKIPRRKKEKVGAALFLIPPFFGSRRKKKKGLHARGKKGKGGEARHPNAISHLLLLAALERKR